MLERKQFRGNNSVNNFKPRIRTVAGSTALNPRYLNSYSINISTKLDLTWCLLFPDT